MSTTLSSSILTASDSSSVSASLPEPDFIARDPEAITTAAVAALESALGKTLYPAQAERLVANVMAYRETLVRIAIQEAAKQNLLAYASYPVLDHLGTLVGVSRLAAQPAQTTLRFTLSAAQPFPLSIPAGRRVRSADGGVVFATDALTQIPAGDTFVDVIATATTAGESGNGWLPGQVATLMDPVAWVASVSNITVSADGSDSESDDRLRERIRLAPHSFSVAGPAGSYRNLAMAVHQDIIDVAVENPSPGVINLYLLTSDGLPSSEMIAAVTEALSAETVRPLGDELHVLPAIAVPFDVALAITVYDKTDPEAVRLAVVEAVTTEARGLALSLGRDVVPSQIAAAASDVAGVYDVALSLPASRVVLDGRQVAVPGTVSVTVTGMAHG